MGEAGDLRLLAADVGGRLDVVGYAVRRAARLLPAYWLVLAAVAVGATPPARDVVIHALALQIYWPDAWIGAFGQSWSIATEIAFYVALPFAVLGLRRLRRRDLALPLTTLCALAVVLTVTSGFAVPVSSVTVWIGVEDRQETGPVPLKSSTRTKSAIPARSTSRIRRSAWDEASASLIRTTWTLRRSSSRSFVMPSSSRRAAMR